MAGKNAPSDDDEPLEPQEPPENEPDEPEEPEEGGEEEPEEPEEGEGEGGEEEGDAETVISWADDAEDEGSPDDSKVIRKIRERNKELARENAELRKAAIAPPPVVEDIGPKPRSVDYNYDDDAYEAALDAWKDKKAKFDSARAETEKQAEEINREWQGDMARYASKREALAVDDYDEVTAPVRTRLSLAQQSVIVKVASDPAAFAYALGGSESRLSELAKIQDPFKFGAAVARMEGGVKVTKRRKTTQPDRAQRGSARVAPVGQDKTLEKLKKEAEDSGDRTQLIAYRKKLKAKEKAA